MATIALLGGVRISLKGRFPGRGFTAWGGCGPVPSRYVGQLVRPSRRPDRRKLSAPQKPSGRVGRRSSVAWGNLKGWFNRFRSVTPEQRWRLLKQTEKAQTVKHQQHGADHGKQTFDLLEADGNIWGRAGWWNGGWNWRGFRAVAQMWCIDRHLPIGRMPLGIPLRARPTERSSAGDPARIRSQWTIARCGGVNLAVRDNAAAGGACGSRYSGRSATLCGRTGLRPAAVGTEVGYWVSWDASGRTERAGRIEESGAAGRRCGADRRRAFRNPTCCGRLRAVARRQQGGGRCCRLAYGGKQAALIRQVGHRQLGEPL